MAAPGTKTLNRASWTDHKCASSAELAQELAVAVASALRVGLQARGRASVALSGGKTPLRFFDALSREKLDWANVYVTLADERWVPATSERSNTKLVLEHLLINAAKSAHYISLYADAPTPELGMSEVTSGLAALPLPFDAVVLGMGDDGHTASWFPQGDHLTQALDMSSKLALVPMRAPAAPEARITFTAPVLLGANQLFLHFETAPKRAVFDQACSGDDVMKMPIRAALLAKRERPVQVYWCD